MKTLSLLFLLCAGAAYGQAPIRATTTMHADDSRTTTVVDPEKMTAEETTVDFRDRVIRKVTYLLDENSQPIGSITYDAKGAVQYRVSYKRDPAGRVNEENVTSPTGVFIRRRVYTYGSGNQVTGITEYDAQGRANVLQAKSTASPSRGRPDKKKR